MKPWRLVSVFLALAILLAIPGSALAQTYLFSLDQLTAHVYWQEDGTMALAYEFVFSNDPSADPIDYIDIGLPNGNFDVGRMEADVDGKPIGDFSSSGYMGDGTGVAIGLGANAIQPGQTGTVHFYAEGIQEVLYPDSQDSAYASGKFSPVNFGSKYVTGRTDMMVVFHLPPGVKPEQPRWHSSPAGWPSEPSTSLDENGRVTYTWANADARAYLYYEFGASFPASYVPESTIKRPGFFEKLGISGDDALGFLTCCGFATFFIGMVAFSIRSTSKRKLEYLPPKIAIEGHGIKRGLTAVESAILLQQPMDKILTMILFAVIKKGAAEVITKEPLKLKINNPRPEGLQEYETQFLDAFATASDKERRKLLQELMIALVKSVTAKLKGFSRKETVAYYKGIVERAWKQVEDASTPEVKSEKYDEVMEWTMMDKNYEDRTRDVFRSGPIYVPTWWNRFDPDMGRASSTAISTSAPASGGTGSSSPSMSMPTVPGSSFAASVIGGVQGFASNVVGNVNDFTSGVTTKTNPIPVSTSSSRPGGGFRSGGGGGCACACACAGCACACAGGGR